MDVVLEVADAFVFDRIYAALLPAQSNGYIYDPLSTVAASFKGFADAPNATWDGIAEAASSVAQWTYQPSTQFFGVSPSQFAYMSQWPRDNIYRQALSLYLITWLMGMFLYFTFATLSYIFVFDRETFNHPKYLKNQMSLEIKQTLQSIPIMAIFTVPFFVAEVRGHSYIYDTIEQSAQQHFLTAYLGSTYTWLQFPLFLMFTDFAIYWIHRGLHSKFLYKRLHKPHHKWIMPTPFASHAFHPLDGYAQSVPYHLFPFMLPLQKFSYIALFTFIQIWTVMIHDGEYVANSPVINGAACHTMHHLYFNYNYGQFTTLWDRLGGSYRKPNMELFIKETKMSGEEWARQKKEMEHMVKEVEGEDDRSYGPPEEVAKKVQ